MKKIVALISFIIATAGVIAQDTVKMDTPHYLMHNTDDSLHFFPRYINSLAQSAYPNFPYHYLYANFPYNDLFFANENLYHTWYYLSLYAPADREGYIYGIALTAENLPEESHLRHTAPYLALYEVSNHFYDSTFMIDPVDCQILNLIDTLSLFENRKQRVFEYDISGLYSPSEGHWIHPPEIHYVTNTELYFNKPYPLSALADSFYVALVWPKERRDKYNSFFSEIYDSLKFYPCLGETRLNLWGESWGMAEFSSSNPPCLSNNINSHDIINGDSLIVYNRIYDPVYYRPWGVIFPITGLRCSAPKAKLVERGNGTATVSWWQAEAGEVYQTAIGRYMDGIDSATVAHPINDTVYTFSDIEPDVPMGVWVRKACRYTTAAYDTLVWSDWSQPVVFRTVGIHEVADGDDFSVTPNPACATAAVALPPSADGGRLLLCDLAGRTLAEHTVSGQRMELNIATLHPGAYLLKLVTPRGISTRRLLVQ